MYIKPFAVEEWMNEYEINARYNIAETCVDSISVDELFELIGGGKEAFLEKFCARRLVYGDILGAPAFKRGVCSLYKTISEDEVITTHGAAGASHHVFFSLVEPGDRVISIMPTYQQLYSIPESYGADLHLLHLKQENDYLPDLDELRALVTPDTKLICINNPNNPTGALMSGELLRQNVEIARSVDAYVLCDEVYRHLTQDDAWSESIVDIYEKGISLGSMSKAFSLAGLRLGWVATHDKAALAAMISHRDYNHISCGLFDEALATVALEHRMCCCSATALSSERIWLFWMRGWQVSPTSAIPSRRQVLPRWCITIMISPLASSATICGTPPALLLSPVTASSSLAVCVSAMPVTSRCCATA